MVISLSVAPCRNWHNLPAGQCCELHKYILSVRARARISAQYSFAWKLLLILCCFAALLRGTFTNPVTVCWINCSWSFLTSGRQGHGPNFSGWNLVIYWFTFITLTVQLKQVLAIRMIPGVCSLVIIASGFETNLCQLQKSNCLSECKVSDLGMLQPYAAESVTAARESLVRQKLFRISI